MITLLDLNISDIQNLDLTVDQFITEDHSWDIAALSLVVPPHIVQTIKGIPLPVNDTFDEPCWGFSGNGEFTVKSATWLAHNFNSPAKWEFSWIWKLDIAPKLKLFIWQLLLNGLPTRNNLIYRNINVPHICPFCNSHAETQDHLFLNCPFIRQYWDADIVSHWMGTQVNTPNLLTLFRDIRHNVNLPVKKIIVSLWSIWKGRNALIFSHIPSTIMSIYSRAFKIFTEWNIRSHLDSFNDIVPKTHSPLYHKTIQVAWSPPAPGVFKINFDGSVCNNFGSAGVVIRDYTGNNVVSRAYNLGTSTPIIAEATALRNSLLLAIEHNIRKLFIEGDNLLIINILQEL